jgi:hypothetical protein
MNDKDILYSIIDRYIDNLLIRNPSLSFLSGPIKKWVYNYIDPYVNLFVEDDDLQVDIASGFVKQELTDKIDIFKKKFKEYKENEKNK